MLTQGCCILCILSCLLAKELWSYQPFKKPRQFCALSLLATSLEKKSCRFLSATGDACIEQGSSNVCFPKQSHFLARFCYVLWIYHVPFAFAWSTENFPFSINSVVTNCYLFTATLKAMTRVVLLEVMLISVTQNNKPVSRFTPRQVELGRTQQVTGWRLLTELPRGKKGKA